jgi:hypothetical protein
MAPVEKKATEKVKLWYAVFDVEPEAVEPWEIGLHQAKSA